MSLTCPVTALLTLDSTMVALVSFTVTRAKTRNPINRVVVTAPALWEEAAVSVAAGVQVVRTLYSRYIRSAVKFKILISIDPSIVNR